MHQNDQVERQHGETVEAGPRGTKKPGQAEKSPPAEQNGKNGQGPVVEDTEGIEQQLQAEQQKAEEYLDLLKRTQADFVNYRRRMSQEQGEARTQGQIQVLREILPVLDDFERALAATPKELAAQPWVQGLNLVGRRLSSQLNQLGVKPIGAAGEKFDPRLHEAISLAPTKKETPADSIVEVVRSGYELGDRIIRPAQVVVAKAS